MKGLLTIFYFCLLAICRGDSESSFVASTCSAGQCADSVLKEFRVKNILHVDDATIAYHKVGSGPPLVMMHGFPLSGMTWRKIVPTLSQSFTCIAFDVVGFGYSTSKHDFDFSSKGQAVLFQQALKKLGITKFSLLGNDSGGWISRELALLNVENVERFVLTNTEMPGHRPPFIGEYQFLSRIPLFNRILPHAFQVLLGSKLFQHSAAAFGECFQNLSVIDGEFAELFVNPVQQSLPRLANTMKFLQYMDFKRVDSFAKRHQELKMPVLLLWGDADVTFAASYAKNSMLKQFPNAEFQTISGGKLFMHEEDQFSQLTADAIHEFLTRK